METIHYLKSSAALHILENRHYLLRIDASLNPYAGCSCSCVYCNDKCSGKVMVKTDFLHLLSRELDRLKSVLHVGLGTACEPYCGAEERFNLTRHTLELLARRKLPVQIFTRSNLVLRDMDLLRNHSRQGLLAVSVSISTLNSGKARIIERGSPLPSERAKLLAELKKSGIFAGVLLSPVIPYVTDSKKDLEKIFRLAASCGADYIIPAVLSFNNKKLKGGCTDELLKSFPREASKISRLYGESALPSEEYLCELNALLMELSVKHKLGLSLPVEDEIPWPVDLHSSFPVN